jgi:hypothetical protein
MGFNEVEFLNDSDGDDSLSTLKRDVPTVEGLHNSLKRPLDGFPILYPYLICISPNETREVVKEYRDRIVKISDPVFIAEIDSIFEEWALSGRMDYCLTLARIFKACKKLNISFAPDDARDKLISAATV